MISENEIIAGQFSREETIAFLSGKSAIWGEGRGLYYDPDFTLKKTWDGVHGTGKLSVSEQGAVCWLIPGWGVTPCERYYYKGEKLIAVFKGLHSEAAKHVMGNRIDSF